MASINDETPCLIRLDSFLKVLTIGPKISEAIVPIALDTPVCKILIIFFKNDLIEFLSSSKKFLNDLALLFKNLTKPFITSLRSANKPVTAICFKASFPAFFAVSLATPFIIFLLIAFLASASVFFISSSSASSLSFKRLSFFSFSICFSRSDLLELSIFLLARSFCSLRSFSLCSLLVGSVYSSMLLAPLLLFKDSLVALRFSSMLARSFVCIPACFLRAFSCSSFLETT